MRRWLLDLPHLLGLPHTEEMAPLDGFIYNFLSMGVIFPWVYLNGPAAFPGTNIKIAILLAFVVEIPICITYSILSIEIPGDAGDLRYQTNVFGRFGAAIVLSGFVLSILQWVAISGWLFATVGLAPWFVSAGYLLHGGSQTLLRVGLIIESPVGVAVASVLLAGCALWLLEKGLRVFSIVQRALFALTLVSIVLIVWVMWCHHTSTLISELNSFCANISRYLGSDQLSWDGSGLTFSELTKFDTHQHSYRATGSWKLWPTLAMVPIAWTSFQWATYSVEQNNQIRNSRCFRTQLWMTLGSAVAVFVAMEGLAFAQERGLGKELLMGLVSAWASGSRSASPELHDFLTKVLQPFPNVLAIACSSNLFVNSLIELGFLANAFQIMCNSYIGSCYLLKGMSESGYLPRWHILSHLESIRKKKGDDVEHGTSFHGSTQAGLYRLYALASIPVVVGYNLIPQWSKYTLGVTFACGYVFLFTLLAGFQLSRQLSHSDGSAAKIKWAPPWLGYSSASSVLGIVILLITLIRVPALGFSGLIPMSVVVGLFVLSLIAVTIAAKTTTLLAQAPGKGASK